MAAVLDIGVAREMALAEAAEEFLARWVVFVGRCLLDRVLVWNALQYALTM